VFACVPVCFVPMDVYEYVRYTCVHACTHRPTHLFDLPPAVCQSFYALGQLRPSATPEVIRDFYSYLGILSLAFDAVLQPGCDGGSADFPTRFLNNVSTPLPSPA
jgi:hypothetical protein